MRTAGPVRGWTFAPPSKKRVPAPPAAAPSERKRGPSTWRMPEIRRSRFAEQQIFGFMKQAEAGLAVEELAGKAVSASLSLQVAVQARCPKELDVENARLKKLLAETHLSGGASGIAVCMTCCAVGLHKKVCRASTANRVWR